MQARALGRVLSGERESARVWVRVGLVGYSGGFGWWVKVRIRVRVRDRVRVRARARFRLVSVLA